MNYIIGILSVGGSMYLAFLVGYARGYHYGVKQCLCRDWVDPQPS